MSIDNVNFFSRALFDVVEKKYGSQASARVQSWGGLITQDRNVADADAYKMERANNFFNLVEWVSDLNHWGAQDYWATPIETLATNAGDCEDYSIGKYFSLLNTLVDADKLRITYVKSLTFNQAHMVLAYYDTPSSEPLILDNINGKILPASQRADLLPVYSFNGESIWLARNRGEKLAKASKSSLPQWKSVSERFAEELGGN